MRTIGVVLAAGVTQELAVYGKYFRLMTTVGAVDVQLMSKGRVVEEATNVQAGYYDQPASGFDGVRITSATSQTIQIAVTNGTGGYDRSTGDVNVLPGGVIGVQGPRALSGVPVLADLPVLTRDVGGYPASSFSSSSALAAAGTEAVFLPAANPNGAILYERQVTTNSAAVGTIVLLAKSSAPATFSDGVCHYMINNVAGAMQVGGVIDKPVFIPAGLGLYFRSDQLETFARRFVTYSIL